tara:strand:- start:230 stop:517 length:288 start_codon:yes stop_codon:yes gene_type:complete
MTKELFALVTFKITNGSYENYEYSYYKSKNISGMSHKEIVQEVYDDDDIEVDKDDMHKFWLWSINSGFNYCSVEVYGIEPMTYVELGVLKKFGVL